MNDDQNLLFGVLALQLDLIDKSQFIEACGAWAARKDGTLAAVLTERGWLDEEGRADVEKLLARKVRRRDGDVHMSLAEATSAPVRELMSHVADQEIRKTVSLLPPSRNLGFLELETLELRPEARSHYSLTRLHGEGGLGRVWLARDLYLNRRVALKEILPGRQKDPVSERRFVREAQVTGQLEHPNIVPVYELSQQKADEKLFYAMKYVQGQTLRAAIKQYHRDLEAGTAGPLDLRRLLQAFLGVCHAVDYAHSRGVIHRDLKPSNVMLGAFGEVTLLDWGLAKVAGEPSDEDGGQPVKLASIAEDDLTQYGQALGSLPYMAPEQADPTAGVVDHRTDIYGLGGILFATLTSSAPHKRLVDAVRSQGTDQATRTQRLLRQIAVAPTPAVQNVAPSAPKALHAACAKAMARNPSDRYQTAQELADDVQRWLADEPVSVYGEPWSHRLSRWMRHHRAWTQAIAASLLIVTLISTVASLAVDRARRAEKAAKAEAVEALEAESRAKQDADRRFRESLNTVDTMLTGVGDVLRYYPAMQPLRTQLLEQAADDYRRFAAEVKNDPRIQAEAARSLLRLGDAYRRLGQHDDAAEAFGQARDMLATMVSHSAGIQDIELELIECLLRLGGVQTETARHDQAEQTLDQAETRLNRLNDSAPALHTRARLHVNQALSKDAIGHTEEATGLLEETESTLQKLVQSDTESQPGYRETLAWAWSIHGQILIAAGQPQTALEPLKKGAELYRQLLEEDLTEPRYHEGLAFSRIQLASALQVLGDVQEETAQWQESIIDLDVLLKLMTDVAPFNDYLAVSQANLGRAFHQLGQNQLARDELDKALDTFYQRRISSESPLPSEQEQLALACTLQGQILRDLGDSFAEDNLESAKIVFDVLLDAHPDSTDYLRGRAECERHMARLLHGLGRLDEAQLAYDRAITGFASVLDSQGDDPYARDGLAWCHEHLGDLQAALGQDPHQQHDQSTRIRQKLCQTRGIPEDNYKLARLKLKTGQTRDALALASGLEKAVSGNPNYRTLLGAVQYRTAELDQSIQTLTPHESFEADGESQFWLAMALCQRNEDGDREKAERVLRMGIELMGQNAPARLDLMKLRDEAEDALEDAG